MARQYKQRTKSTKSKTYQDYLKMRRELMSKGIVLKDQMSEKSFYNYYDRLKEAKKAGDIKSQPWQELKSREIYLSTKQARALSIASKEMKRLGISGFSYTPSQIRSMATSQTVYEIGMFLNMNKDTLFSGDYE